MSIYTYIYVYKGLGFLYTYVYSTSVLTPDRGASEVERDLGILTVKNHRDFRVMGCGLGCRLIWEGFLGHTGQSCCPYELNFSNPEP